MNIGRIKKIQDCDLKGQRVLVRVDFNVPLKAVGDGYEVADDNRIRAALPTIEYIINQGGKCILLSHLGRPNGQKVAKYSLEPVGIRLSQLLGKDVVFTEDCIGDVPRGLSVQMKNGEVMLLENVRFHAGEEANALDFAEKLLKCGDIFVSDAFGTLHRAHASTSAVPRLAPQKCMGLLVQKELEYLLPLRDDPKRPFVLIMGGSKVSDKMAMMAHFLGKVDKILVGGAMAYAFLKAKGIEVGISLAADDQVALAKKIIDGALVRKIELLLPIDHVVAATFDSKSAAEITSGPAIPVDRMGLDIGPKTIELFGNALKFVETVFWNGPLGVFENPAFSHGTFAMAQRVAQCDAIKLAGGGDVAAAISQSGVSGLFDFISTGGGATLEFLEGRAMPGLKPLELPPRSV